MNCVAIANDGRFELRRPASDTEWECYHSIRERAIWKGLGIDAVDGPYDRDRPVEPGYTPLVLQRNGITVGTMGVQDMGDGVMQHRAIAVDPACQHRGYGSVMLYMAENAGRRDGFRSARVFAHPAALMFYARNGYLHCDWEVRCPIPGAVPMAKRLDLGVAQHGGTVFIAAA